METVQTIISILTDNSKTYDVHIDLDSDQIIILACSDKKTADKIDTFLHNLLADGSIMSIIVE